ncbi:hypothetical protein ABE493_07865 [Stenotrophomonas terrae]|uniref:DUF7210 family protein n=1 Tax=Stenotrophomonas terrae TaxID=405446 RepID=UPI00320A3438
MSTTKKIRIYVPHTHNGKRYVPDAKGIELEVSQPDAAFLESIGATKPPSLEQDVLLAAGRSAS